MVSARTRGADATATARPRGSGLRVPILTGTIDPMPLTGAARVPARPPTPERAVVYLRAPDAAAAAVAERGCRERADRLAARVDAVHTDLAPGQPAELPAALAAILDTLQNTDVLLVGAPAGLPKAQRDTITAAVDQAGADVHFVGHPHVPAAERMTDAQFEVTGTINLLEDWEI